MDIAFLYYYANLGGVTSVIKSRMPALRAAGWKVHTFFTQDVGGVADLRQAQVDSVHVLPELQKNPSVLFAKFNVDLVTVIDMPETIGALRQSYRGPLIYEIHTPIDRVLLRTTAIDLQNSDRVLVPSRWSQSWVRERIHGSWDHGKVGVAPNIIDRSVFFAPPGRPISPARPKIVWVGKIAAYKRWRDAVRILGSVKKAIDCDVIFITGGESTERNTQDFLTELISCELFGRCAWYYNLPVDEMANVYRDCCSAGGLVLSTSEAESFCLVAHEAMSCGVPVVAAKAGALPEVYSGSLSQLLFDIGDLDKATHIIVDALKNRALWSRLSSHGLAEQEKYAPEALSQVYLGELRQATLMANAA